jgi:hypothetical protein
MVFRLKTTTKGIYIFIDFKFNWSVHGATPGPIPGCTLNLMLKLFKFHYKTGMQCIV